jgi:DNA-binding response OmpR family regulator
MWIRAIARRLLGDWSLMSEGFQLNPDEGELRLGDKTFRLRRTEYRLCEYLVMNRGRWVSERELLRAVLDVRHDRETSLVRVHVRHIRKALGELSDCIISRRGHGYQFQLPDAGANQGRGAVAVERASANRRDEAQVGRAHEAVATWERELRRLA